MLYYILGNLASIFPPFFKKGSPVLCNTVKVLTCLRRELVVDTGVDPALLRGGAAWALDQLRLEEGQGLLPHPRLLHVGLSLCCGDDLVCQKPECI